MLTSLSSKSFDDKRGAGFHALAMSMGGRIKQARLAAGLSQAGLGKLAGVSRAAVSQWENGETAPETDRLANLARILKSSVDWLATGREDAGSLATPSEVDFSRLEPVPDMPRDLPVIGMGRGGQDGAFYWDAPRLFAYRPIELLNVRDAYAIMIHGDSMMERFRSGEMIYVHPSAQVTKGDDVVVTLHDGRRFVKRLVRRNDREVVVEQLNPREAMSFPTREVQAIHLIVSSTKVRVA